ncbi:MAG: dephospho-CoA kinase [Candidatus Diapherotrites archaeon]|nr:dephospho-CoA kinase [Candidatus Diapherotrites archaeon]
MIKIAITGNIATGKSLVLGFFKELGIETLSADEIVDKLYSNKEFVKKIFEKFKCSSKNELASIIFSHERKRKELEKIIHPIVKRAIKNFFERNKRKVIVAVEVPLLFEAGMQDMFDKVVVVYATKKQQLERLTAKGLSKEAALKRIKSQIPIEEKIKKADFVIDNSKSIDNTFEQVMLVLRKLED